MVSGPTILFTVTKIGLISLIIGPIFNPKPPLESSEPQLLPYVIRMDLAIAPCAFIRHITVFKVLLDTKGIWGGFGVPPTMVHVFCGSLRDTLCLGQPKPI